MKYLTREHISDGLWNGLPPVLQVDQGEPFVLGAADALSGRMRYPEVALPEAEARFDSDRKAGPFGANPGTGPGFVGRAEPGHTLAARIHVEDYGWDRGEAYLLSAQAAGGRLCSDLGARATTPKKYL
jgi:acetamidase/formamidase